MCDVLYIFTTRAYRKLKTFLQRISRPNASQGTLSPRRGGKGTDDPRARLFLQACAATRKCLDACSNLD